LKLSDRTDRHRLREVLDERVGPIPRGQRIAVLVGLLERLQRFVPVVHVRVRPAKRVTPDDGGQQRARARKGKRSSERDEADLRHTRSMNANETRDGVGIRERQSKAQVSAHRVADDALSADSERTLQRGEPIGEHLRMVRAIVRALRPSRPRKIRHVAREAFAERAEGVAPRIARRHETMHEKERRARPMNTNVGAKAAERRCVDGDLFDLRFEVSVRNARPAGEVFEPPLSKRRHRQSRS
jgi:hypothetical protein